jgi:Family of unknown function (DUF5636)
MKKQTPKEIGEEIQKYFPYFAQDKLKEGKSKFKGTFEKNAEGLDVYQGTSSLFYDLCQIGALLTDIDRCNLHLKALDELMVKELLILVKGDAQNLRPQHTTQQRSKESDPVNLKLLSSKEKWLATNPPKFYGVLKRILWNHETKWGFNKEVNETPTLSGFVHPTSFNELLLKQARHWKDPGASINHGEYTHRLQWWIICSEHYCGGIYRLKADPVKRFRQLPKYATSSWRNPQIESEVQSTKSTVEVVAQQPTYADVYTNRSLWDYLCDAVPLNDTMAATTPASDSFRSPQFMNLYLTDPSRMLVEPKFPALYNFLVARFNKRTWQFVNNMLRPYKNALIKKWNLTNEDEFDKLFEDASKYGISDLYATVDGKIVTRPKKS